MKAKMLKSAGLLVSMSFVFETAYSQELRVSLFDEVNRSMLAARESQADVLSPKAYDEAMESYNRALKDYKDEGEISKIKESITKAEGKFAEATDNTKVSSVMFSQVLSARKDAMNAEASQFSKTLWADAEEEMKDAAGEMEKGDANDAKEKAATATGLYRKAELESIKVNYLSNAKRLIQQADNNKVQKVAPKTLNEAKVLVNRAEKELAENRYDTDEARFLAKEAEYKALLAMYIAQQAKMLDDKDFETEDFLLMSYEPLKKIGETLDLDVKFDKGTEGPVSQIVTRMNNDALRISNLEADLYDNRQQNDNLTQMLAEQRKIQVVMEGELSDEATESQKRQDLLQARIDQVADIDAKFDKIQQIFTQEEAQVFRQKNDVIIRLIGVNFDINQAQIKQEDYAVLTKVQSALRIFDNAAIVIEGHTDSQGGDDTNLELSQARADAVLSYLNANTTIDKSRFSTKGFGESKPVANNESVAGRTQNRRIDIVIRPTLTNTSSGVSSSSN